MRLVQLIAIAVVLHLGCPSEDVNVLAPSPTPPVDATTPGPGSEPDGAASTPGEAPPPDGAPGGTGPGPDEAPFSKEKYIAIMADFACADRAHAAGGAAHDAARAAVVARYSLDEKQLAQADSDLKEEAAVHAQFALKIAAAADATCGADGTSAPAPATE